MIIQTTGAGSVDVQRHDSQHAAPDGERRGACRQVDARRAHVRRRARHRVRQRHRGHAGRVSRLRRTRALALSVGSASYKGAIDETALFGYVLQASDVDAIYQASVTAPYYPAGSAAVAVVEQDTVEHVMSCETVIVHHPLGYRDDRPEFGWQWPELANVPLNLASLEQALRQFEPRGSASASQYADIAVAALQHVSVDVAIPSTQEAEQ